MPPVTFNGQANRTASGVKSNKRANKMYVPFSGQSSSGKMFAVSSQNPSTRTNLAMYPAGNSITPMNI